MHEHSEEPREASSQNDTTVTARLGPLSLSPGPPLSAANLLRLQRTAGNRAVARLVGAPRRVQRRTAVPERSDKTKTFTYSLKLYTVDAESYEEALEVASTLNAFAPTVFDIHTQSDYAVRFQITVYAPPEPEVLERAFGIKLHYSAGRERLRPKRYREAAERWWLEALRQPGNLGNLYLGNRPPSEETKDFMIEVARGIGVKDHKAIDDELRTRLGQAKSENDRDVARSWWRKENARLNKNPPEKVVKAALEKPKDDSRGTTFAHLVTQMRAPRGAQYSLNVRIHEVMHLLGLVDDHTSLRQSVMSYPYLGQNREKSVMPQPDDIEQLVNVDNPPSDTSVD